MGLCFFCCSSPPPNQNQGASGQILETPKLKVYTFAELKSATQNFQPDALLGQGSYGKVYKGWVDEKTLAPSKRRGSGMLVAIKELNPQSFGGFSEWQSEVKFLGRLSHPNLVKLLGYCGEERKLALVYEFIPKGSLGNRLFRLNPAVEPLSWDLRLKILIGAARGLAFLHGLDRKIIYRDFKSWNILLDTNYDAKISDFGLAKLGPSSGKTHISTLPGPLSGKTHISTYPGPLSGKTHIGTLPGPSSGKTLISTLPGPSSGKTPISTLPGPLSGKTPISTLPGPLSGKTHISTLPGPLNWKASENGSRGYIATDHLDAKIDVYMFGVVILETMTGLHAHDRRRPDGQKSLVDWLRPCLSNEIMMKEIMDRRIKGQYSSKAAIEMAQITLKCIQYDPEKRPSMTEVVIMLENIERLEIPECSIPNSSSSHPTPLNYRDSYQASNSKKAMFASSAEAVGRT